MKKRHDYEEEIDQGPSKTQRKQAMHDLQELGEALVDLPADQLKRTLAKLDFLDTLVDAIHECRRLGPREARRRQLQYIGRLMRDLDPAPIQAALDALTRVSRAENAKMHKLESLRDELLADEKTLTRIADTYPGVDITQLRQLRRNAIKEREQNKPPKNYRQIFQVLKALEAGGNQPVAEDWQDWDEAEDTDAE